MMWALNGCASRKAIPQTETTVKNQALLDALQGLSFARYLDNPQFAPVYSQAQGWDVYTYRTDDLRCILGGEFFILARRGAEADKTVIWLEGGGSCFPGRDDCSKEAVLPEEYKLQGLPSLDEVNPVKSWNFIYVPYCDGSLHLGDNDADYDNNKAVDHWHWGLKTTSAAVQLMQKLFPASEKILLAGCSAGGGGTIGAAPVVRLQFSQANLYVLNVSGSGLTDPTRPEAIDLIKKTWNIGQLIPGDCPKCNEQLIYMYSWLLERDSELKVGIFSSYYDRVVSTGWGLAPEAFQALLMSTTDAIRAEHVDTFKRFFIAGDMHCIADYSYRVNGVSLWDWVGYLVNDDPGWSDILE